MILLLNALSMKPLIRLVQPARRLYLGLSRFRKENKICTDVMNRMKSPTLNKTARMFSLTVTLKHTLHYNFCRLEELLDNKSLWNMWLPKIRVKREADLDKPFLSWTAYTPHELSSRTFVSEAQDSKWIRMKNWRNTCRMAWNVYHPSRNRFQTWLNL